MPDMREGIIVLQNLCQENVRALDVRFVSRMAEAFMKIMPQNSPPAGIIGSEDSPVGAVVDQSCPK